MATFSQGFSRICDHSDEYVAKLSPPKQCPDLDSLHFPESHAQLTTIIYHFQTAHGTGIQKVRLPKKHQEDIHGSTRNATKCHKFQFEMVKMVVGKDMSFYCENQN